MTASVNGISDNILIKVGKAGDCKIEFGTKKRTKFSSMDKKSLEKIGLSKGSINKKRERIAPMTKVFHAKRLVYSIEDMFL
jgi:coenzyme F420-reducing hydrogenase delta subunit